MTKTPKDAQDDLAYVREAIEYQRRMVCEHLPPWLAALTALYLLVAVGSRYYLDDSTGDMVGNYSTLIMVGIVVAFSVKSKRKRSANKVGHHLSARALRNLLLPAIGMFAAILVLAVARSELGLAGDQFRIAALLIVGVSMFGIGKNGPATGTTMGLSMVLGALALIFGQYMVLGALLAGGVMIGSWIDQKYARGLDA